MLRRPNYCVATCSYVAAAANGHVMPRGDALSALSLIWCLQQGLILSYARLATPFDQVQALLIAATALTGAAWLPALCAALACRIYANTVAVFPNAWESLYWCAQTDLALLLSLLARVRVGLSLSPRERREVVVETSRVVRWQLAGWYLSAAFFKLNTSFLDHRYSCASPYLAQLLAAYLPAGLVAPAQLAAAVSLAPVLVVAGEAVLGLALVAAAAGRGGRCAAPLGVVLALLLHLAIAMTPPPNNIGAFSVIMAARLPAFVGPDAMAASTSLPRGLAGLGGLGALLAAAAAAAAGAARATAAGGSGSAASEGDAGQMSIMFFAGLDWSVPTLVLMIAALLRGLVYDIGWFPSTPATTCNNTTAKGEGAAVATKDCTDSNQDGIYSSLLGPCLVALAWSHAFAGPIVGVQDLGSSNMYGNLRMLGGSNHLLIPTNLLRASGEIVRVESSTSSVINALYPGEISSVITPRATQVLRDANHTGRQFNFAMGRVLGSWALPPPAFERGEEPFVRYTVPTLELRRMLAEARAGGDAFELVYTILDGSFGDEAWRASSVGRRRVRIREDPSKGERQCTVLSQGDRPCDDSDIPNLPTSLKLWERALGVWNPHPILPGEHEEMHCFGP